MTHYIDAADWRDQFETAQRATLALLHLADTVHRAHYDDHDGPIRFCTEPACVLVAQHYPAA
jgi:hypothetical protein